MSGVEVEGSYQRDKYTKAIIHYTKFEIGETHIHTHTHTQLKALIHTLTQTDLHTHTHTHTLTHTLVQVKPLTNHTPSNDRVGDLF